MTTPSEMTERRGKKSVNASPSSAQPAAKPKKPTLSEQLDRAAESIEKNAFQMQTLHSQWKKYLVVLSYLVVILSFHQMNTVSTECLKDIKSFNRNRVSGEGDDSIITGVQATAIVLKDSAPVLLGIIMAVLLSLFLRSVGEDGNSTADFSHPFFLTAQTCILPMLIIQYYYSMQYNNGSSSSSCLDVGGIAYSAEHDLPLKPSAAEQQTNNKKTLPVVLVFHVIVTLCLYFMKKQQYTLRKNEQAVAQLRNELNEATAKGKNNKKKK